REGERVAGTGRETIPVSNPAPCASCEHPEPEPATYQGASADGSKVFFTTEQELLPEDKDVANRENGGNDLYVYDEVGESSGHLVQLSRGNCETEKGTTCGTGAEVQGVVRTSSDGSHVCFVARGVLTNVANSYGQRAEAGADNLYAVDTA